jgi:hypothetical protein
MLFNPAVHKLFLACDIIACFENVCDPKVKLLCILLREKKSFLLNQSAGNINVLVNLIDRSKTH